MNDQTDDIHHKWIMRLYLGLCFFGLAGTGLNLAAAIKSNSVVYVFATLMSWAVTKIAFKDMMKGLKS